MKRPLSTVKIIILVLSVALTLVAVKAYAIARGYLSDDSGLKIGMVVRLSDNGGGDNPKVERASNDNPTQIIGVTVSPDTNLVTIASGEAQVYVESTGDVNAYVSDLSGDIKSGDSLTLSPLKGILTKVDNTSSVVVGVALEDFSGKAKETYTINDDNGDKTVQAALLKITLDRRVVPAATGSDSSLKRLGRALVGKEVNEIRIIVALVIFFIVVVSTGGVLYGAVTSAITAFGRNPLAKSIIKRQLAGVVVLALGVLIIGVAAVYAVLWV